ncbi:hypothetical protein ACGFZL_14035 [Streptomyces sp. NPDC048182]|uniref:hypothetical protein n=1 Tax=Streptomyces sp. NPDC048182 TaxID=3365507 RepID=UPI003721F49D
MSDSLSDTTGPHAGTTATVHESYSFACMGCGHGWEQSYEIEHYTGADGHRYVRYLADGLVVPSPLSRPTCANCDNHVVRIMRPGRVDSARAHPAVPTPTPGTGPDPAVPRQRRHLTDLLHALHLHREPDAQG